MKRKFRKILNIVQLILQWVENVTTTQKYPLYSKPNRNPLQIIKLKHNIYGFKVGFKENDDILMRIWRWIYINALVCFGFHYNYFLSWSYS